MIKKRVLFVCVHNSARSQMAEELLRKYAGDRFEVESAGLEPGVLNPYVVEVLKEEGINIEGKETKSAIDLLRQGRYYTHLITVCDESSAEKCPIFPGCRERFHWSFPDPSKLKGSEEQILNEVREIKDRIRSKVEEFIKLIEDAEKGRKSLHTV